MGLHILYTTNLSVESEFFRFFFARSILFLYLCPVAWKKGRPHWIMTSSAAILKIKRVAKQAVPVGGTAILYGSRARGDAHQGSDWDILILLNKDILEQEDYDKVSYPFVLLGCDIGEEINPIMYTRKEWESYRITPFYENVTREGICLV